MKVKVIKLAFACALLTLPIGCSPETTTPTANPTTNSATPQQPKTESPGPLPDAGFKAQLTLVDPPAKLRVGQQVRLQVKVKNGSSVFWWARGGPVNTRADNKFYIAVGDRWLKSDGSVLTDMDGRAGIGKDLNPGEEVEVSFLIAAPKQPGDYTLEVDLVQEQVTWFREKGSPTTTAKVSVTK